jgi:hypothetical protein
MGLVSTYIRHQIAVIVTASSDVNRHSSSFKMATVLNEWPKVRSVIRFLLKKNPPIGFKILTAVFMGYNAV